MDERVEKIINSQFVELLSNFKPVFGNQQHIELGKLLITIEKTTKELQKKTEDAKDAKKLRGDLSRFKKQALFLIKNI